jgi:hypothetical protein
MNLQARILDASLSGQLERLEKDHRFSSSGHGPTAETGLETGHEGAVARELDRLAWPSAGCRPVSGGADGGNQQAAGRGFERDADRFVEEREPRGPMAEGVSAQQQPAVDEARLDVSCPVSAGTEHAEHIAQVGALEDGVGAIAP